MTGSASPARSTNGGITLTRPIPEAGRQVLVAAGVEPRVLQPRRNAAVERRDLLRAMEDSTVLLPCLTERIDESMLVASPYLRGIANFAVGFDNIDIAAATRLGISVSNTPGVLTEATADLTWALLLAVARRIPEAHAYTANGHYEMWGPELLLGTDVGTGPDGQPSVLGIIGLGRIGKAVARRAHGFGMRVLAHGPHPAAIAAHEGVEYAPLDALLEQSDFITLHARYTRETHHIIDERAFGRMKPTSFLINVARGELVHESALVHALRTRAIAGAALDVYENEPRMADGLTACDNVVLAPHIGSATVATRDRMARIAAMNALAHFRLERAPNAVNPHVYESEAYRVRVARCSG